MADQPTDAQLNRLYWETDESVSAIAERLGVSRRALYDAIRPRPAGAACPECGAPLGFRNRTAAEHREAECPECGRELEVGADVESEPEQEPDDRLESPDMEQEERAAALSPARRVPPAGDAPFLGIVLLIGIALGGALVWLLRRR